MPEIWGLKISQFYFLNMALAVFSVSISHNYWIWILQDINIYVIINIPRNNLLQRDNN